MNNKTKKFITTTGYYGTGSSAITDMLLDHNKMTSLGEYEFKFLQDINGVSDLEFRFVENHHRHNSGHALKLYLKYAKSVYGFKFKKGYNYFFGKRWIEESKKYISNLTGLTFNGYYNQDLLELPRLRYYFKGFLNTVAKKTGLVDKEGSLNLLPKEKTHLGFVSKEEFHLITRQYVENLFSDEKFSKNEYIFIDQAVPASNIARYTKYFNDLKVFVLERDPRDIYLLEKHVWKTKCYPTGDVNDFCVWFDLTRKHRETEVYESNVMFLYFEELIYKYDETKKKIEAFLGLENINQNKKYFNPEKSIKNTQVWKRYPAENENIKIIEDKLAKYLYKGYHE